MVPHVFSARAERWLTLSLLRRYVTPRALCLKFSDKLSIIDCNLPTIVAFLYKILGFAQKVLHGVKKSDIIKPGIRIICCDKAME